MTDRVDRLTVILAHDIRTDDIEPLVNAIKQFHLVLGVELGIADSDCVPEMRIRRELEDKLWAALRAPKKGS